MEQEITRRPWGFYTVLHQPNSQVKVKELYVEPGKSLSMQRHTHRSELWLVAEGYATLWTHQKHDDKNIMLLKGRYQKFDVITIEKSEWHKLENHSTIPLKIIEIQYGSACDEDDIERI